jgi:hypothetical protein
MSAKVLPFTPVTRQCRACGGPARLHRLPFASTDVDFPVCRDCAPRVAEHLRRMGVIVRAMFGAGFSQDIVLQTLRFVSELVESRREWPKVRT